MNSDIPVPGGLDEIRVQVTDGNGQVSLASGQLMTDEALPVSVRLVHRRGPLENITVDAIGLVDEREVVRRTARFSFIRGQDRQLSLFLASTCVDEQCAMDETCIDGLCQLVDETPLDPDAGVSLADDGPTVGDVGARDAGLDAAPEDAGADDAGPIDAGPVDAGPVDAGPVDAGPLDAGPFDAGPPMCTGLPAVCSMSPLDCTCDTCTCDVVCALQCEVECRDSPDCGVAANDQDEVDVTCQRTTCDVQARRVSTVNVQCEDDSSCVVDAQRAGNVDVRCNGGSACEVDCTNASSCRVRCQGAECLVDCAGSPSCSISPCTGGSGTTCPGTDIRVCGRACP